MTKKQQRVIEAYMWAEYQARPMLSSEPRWIEAAIREWMCRFFWVSHDPGKFPTKHYLVQYSEYDHCLEIFERIGVTNDSDKD